MKRPGPLLALLLALTACLAPAARAVALGATPGPTPTPTPPHVVVPQVRLLVPGGVWLGDVATVKVTVDPALVGAPIALETQVGGEWSVEATGTLDAASLVRFSWRPRTYGPARLRASLPAGEGYEAAVSASHRLLVNRPNRHHVLYKYAHYIVIVVHEYRLYYYEHGAVVRAFDVALGRPGYRTPLGTFHIYYKRRPAGGALGACAMFYRHKGGIAIHGTDQPHLLRRFPRAFSHGCARMYNSHALWLYDRVPKGTTVRNVR
jgi:hypothetical protein